MSKPLEVSITKKSFGFNGNDLPILGEFFFQLTAGEIVTLIGPSGCGKTTILRMILGLDNNYEGLIRLGGQQLRDPGLDRGVVFQEPRLIPWMNVRKNIEFAVPQKTKLKPAAEHINTLIKMIGLADFQTAFPNQLSGGMAQRVALARALVNVPELLLLDEPFGALDSHTRMQMQEELLKVLKREGTTTLMITHDVDEAVYLSDRIIVLTSRPAKIRAIFEIDSPRPRNRTDSYFQQMRSKVLQTFYE